MSLGGRVAETERSHGGVAVHQTTGVISGTTSRTSRSLALVFPETVEFLGRDEILSGGESTKRPRDPDLHILDLGLDPLPFSASSSCSSSSALVPEGLTRLDSSLDLAKLPVEHKDQVVQAYGSPVLVTSQQARTEAHDSTTQGRAQHPGYTQDDIPIPYLTTTRWKKSDETRSGTSVTSNSSSTSCNSESDPDDRPSSASYETFFDPSPSSAEASPTSLTYPDTANHNDNKNDTNTDTGTDNHVDNDSNNNKHGDRFVPPVPTMVPELSESINSKLSSATPSPTLAGPDGTTTGLTNMQWRPRSAPKTSYSRSASPLLFWNRKGNQQQQHQQQQHSQHQQPGAGDTDAADWFVAETREGDDATYVDSISNHLGKMTTTTTTPAKSGPGTLNGWADLKDSTLAAQEENQATAGTPPSITREEYEALPLAIQRKV